MYVCVLLLTHNKQSKSATTRAGRFKTTLVVSHADSAATTIIRDLNQKHTLTPLGWDIETRVRVRVRERVRVRGKSEREGAGKSEEE